MKFHNTSKIAIPGKYTTANMLLDIAYPDYQNKVEVISNEVTRKIMDLSIEISKPIGFGVLTCENMNQAEDRSSNNKNNKGSEAAKACLKLLLDGQ